MRNPILPVLLVLSLSSCVTYQYLTVDSSELQKDDQKQLITENDTLRLIYGFSGGGGPVTITAFNKTNQPMFINWAKSAIIRDGQSFSLYGANSAFVGSATPTGTGTADLTGTVSVPPGTEFIPPQTKITRSTVYLNQTGGSTRTIMPDTVKKQRYTLPDGAVESYFQVSYAETQSPVRWKSYLTFVTGSGSGTEFTVSHTFYVGTVMETHYAPAMFKLYHEPGDQFYVFWQQN
jgi:hypothetical protein